MITGPMRLCFACMTSGRIREAGEKLPKSGVVIRPLLERWLDSVCKCCGGLGWKKADW